MLSLTRTGLPFDFTSVEQYLLSFVPHILFVTETLISNEFVMNLFLFLQTLLFPLFRVKGVGWILTHITAFPLPEYPILNFLTRLYSDSS